MKRTVRNGLAIAGMAGGIFFLGEAVAGASEGANAAGEVTSTTASQSGDATSTNVQDVDARNSVDNEAETGIVNAGGGSPSVGVVAGNGNGVDASSGKGDVHASQHVTTVVNIAVEANGGSVSGSNNASAGNAAHNEANAAGSIDSTTTAGSGKHGGDAYSTNYQDVDARNSVDNEAETGIVDAGGGSPAVGVVAGNGNHLGAGSYWGDVGAHQNVDTETDLAVEANGGSVSDSNNASAGNGAHNAANAAGEIDSVTEAGSGRHSDADSWNEQEIDARNDVENEAETGIVDAGGGSPTIGVVAGNGNTLYCSSVKGDVHCNQDINVVINIIAEANGGTVTCSNNAAAGNAAEWVCKLPEAKPAPAPTAPEATPAPAPAPTAPEAKPAPVKSVHHTVAPVTKQLSSAQPSGQLASTGAEVSVPLTVGLIALAAGTGLAFATRRRAELV